MFVMFGWGRKNVKDYGPTIPTRCNSCSNKVYLNLICVRHWFVMFSVPVIPYKKQYYLICEDCSKKYEVTGEDVEEALYYNKITNDYLNNDLQEEEYTELIKRANETVRKTQGLDILRPAAVPPRDGKALSHKSSE